jgi:hypothetical protein
MWALPVRRVPLVDLCDFGNRDLLPLLLSLLRSTPCPFINKRGKRNIMLRMMLIRQRVNRLPVDHHQTPHCVSVQLEAVSLRFRARREYCVHRSRPNFLGPISLHEKPVLTTNLQSQVV